VTERALGRTWPDDFEPATVPIRNAATVLILDERPELQVLMLKRNARSVFAADMWVFPGGAVDDHDATLAADALVVGRTDAECSAELGLAAGGIAHWVAALRETFEEAGVLIASDRSTGELVDFRDPAVAARFDDHRDVVNTTESAFIDIVASEGLDLDGAGVHYVAQWITPLGPPRRYDARFFVTRMPAGQVPLHDDDEAVHHEWVRPADALAANERDQMIMMTPTLSMLQRLATFTSAADALAAAAGATPADDEWVRIRRGVDGHRRIAYPADGDYADADAETEYGLLRWPAGRGQTPSGRAGS
jgi:8-oxo-dGTP pyrophosphatase MutT (NUDIX family)